jgi:hypothetical protein
MYIYMHMYSIYTIEQYNSTSINRERYYRWQLASPGSALQCLH